MKKIINVSLALALASVTLTGCEDLDNRNMSKYVTTDDKVATLVMNPDMAMAGVSGISAAANQYESVFANHFDFGYASTMLGTDLQSDEMLCDRTGYNWFNYWEGFTSPTAGGTPAAEAWYILYKQIFACNSVSQSIPSDTETPELMFNRAQALLTRSFDYWVLAQLFQFNYDGNQSKPCVPIVTDENAVEVEQNGAPRATVEETYAQILADINEAIDLLDKAGLQPSAIISSKPKRFGSLATAYGQRARIYLTMHKYAEAAKDARQAITLAEASGIRCKSIAEAGRPSFWSIDETDWMWGIPVNESDRVVTSGIVNWPSHMNTFCANGYVNVGAWKYLNADLYAQIPATDIRKGWFLDENLHSDNLNSQELAYCQNQDAPIPPYTNVKFAGYNDVVGATTNSNDIPLMRLEEMYLIEAEGLAMSGGDGAAALTAWVSQYRNPSYTCTKSGTDVQADVYFQRRIELYGEGLSWFDKMRLNLPVNRIVSNAAPEYAFYVPEQGAVKNPDHALVRIYCIPTGEITGNRAINESDNNTEYVKPDPATWQP